jgi:hypothetical protein
VPAPVDDREVRFSHAVVAVVLLAGFVFSVDWALPALTVVVGLAAVVGPPADVFALAFRAVVGDRMGPPTRAADPVETRFAAAATAVVLAFATVLWLVGLDGVAWIVGLLLAGVSALTAATGSSPLRDVYRQVRRRGPR